MRVKTFLSLTVFLVAVHHAACYAGYRRTCRQGTSRESEKCDPEKFLYCETRSYSSPDGTCECRGTGDMYYNERSQRCEVYLRRTCKPGFGARNQWGSGDYERNGGPVCGEGSDCDQYSGLCICKPGYRPNSDNQGCSGAAGFSNILPIVVGMVIAYICALKIIK